MTSVLLICAILAPVLAKPNGYYHQEYNYQTSSSSYKNHELQHHNEDEGFYSKDGDLEGRLRPRVNTHSQHSEYVNPKLQHGYRIGTDRTSSFGQLHAQNRYRMGEPGFDGMMTPVHDYGVQSNLRQVTAMLQQEMERELQRAVYDHYQRAVAYGGSITEAQIEADRRAIEEELRRNVTMRLQEALKTQYGNQGIRGAYSYSITNGRLQPSANYNNQELADLTRQMEENLMRTLDQQVRTYYHSEVHTHTQRNTYQHGGYPGALQQRPPVPVYHPYPPPPPPHPNPVLATPDSITTVATRVQTELNEILNKILEDTQRRYFSENSFHNNAINYDAILATLQDELRANITFHFDDQIKRAYGYTNYASKYSVEDIENLRRQIENNLITKLNRDFNRQREKFYQTHQIYPSPRPIPANHVFYPMNTVRHQVDMGHLQRQMQEQLSRQLQEALMRHSYAQTHNMYQGSNFNAQANYQRTLEQMSAELNRNLTRQMEQLNEQQYLSGAHEAQLAALRGQLQHDLMRQLQQGLQQSYSQYSSWSSSSRSSSSNSNNYRPVRGFDPNLYRNYGMSGDVVGEDCMMGDDPGAHQRPVRDLTQQTADLTQQIEDEDLTQQTQDDDLTQQTEDLTQQTQADDLTQQTEDLTQQTEDLTQQTQQSEDLTQQVQTQSQMGPAIYQKPPPKMAYQVEVDPHQDLTQQSQDLTQQSQDLTQQSQDLTQQSQDLTQQSQDLTQQTDLTEPKSYSQVGPVTQPKMTYQQYVEPDQDLTQQSQDLTQQTQTVDTFKPNPYNPRIGPPVTASRPVVTYAEVLRRPQDLTQQIQSQTLNEPGPYSAPPQPKPYRDQAIREPPVQILYPSYKDLTQQSQRQTPAQHYVIETGPAQYYYPLTHQMQYVQEPLLTQQTQTLDTSIPAQDLTQQSQSQDLTQNVEPPIQRQQVRNLYKPHDTPRYTSTYSWRPQRQNFDNNRVGQRVQYYESLNKPTSYYRQQQQQTLVTEFPPLRLSSPQSPDLTQQNQDLTQQTEAVFGPSVGQQKPLSQFQDLTQQSQELTQQNQDLTHPSAQLQDLTQQIQTVNHPKPQLGQPLSYEAPPMQYATAQTPDLTQQTETAFGLPVGQDLTQQTEQVFGSPVNQRKPVEYAQVEDLTQQNPELTQFEDLTQQSPDLTQQSQDLTQQSQDLTQQSQDLTQQTEQVVGPPASNRNPSIQYAQVEDLTQQNQDLTQQSQDLTQQTEDLTQQSQDLTQQSQDLTQQSQDLTQQTEDVDQPIEPQPSSNKLPKDQQFQQLAQQTQDFIQQEANQNQFNEEQTTHANVQQSDRKNLEEAEKESQNLINLLKQKSQQQQEIGPMSYSPKPVYGDFDGHQIQVGSTRNQRYQPPGRTLVAQNPQTETLPEQETQTVVDIEPVEPQVASEVQQVDEKQTQTEPTTKKPGFWSRLGTSIKNKIG